MVEKQLSITDGGGIEIRITDGNGDVRAVVLEPSDDGNITIEGRGPNGKKRGVMDPSGNGNNPLGK